MLVEAKTATVFRVSRDHGPRSAIERVGWALYGFVMSELDTKMWRWLLMMLVSLVVAVAVSR